MPSRGICKLDDGHGLALASLLGDRPWHWQVSAHLLRLALASLASGPLHNRAVSRPRLLSVLFHNKKLVMLLDESHARQGIWQFDIMLFDIPYNFNLYAMNTCSMIAAEQLCMACFSCYYVCTIYI